MTRPYHATVASLACAYGYALICDADVLAFILGLAGVLTAVGVPWMRDWRALDRFDSSYPRAMPANDQAETVLAEESPQTVSSKRSKAVRGKAA